MGNQIINDLIGKIEMAVDVADRFGNQMVDAGFLRKWVEEYRAAQRPVVLWPVKIPDWPEVWASIDSDGTGFMFPVEPIEERTKDGVFFQCEEGSTCFLFGRFDVSLLGDDCPRKILLKKDGVFVR